jgi:hypothetical protein
VAREAEFPQIILRFEYLRAAGGAATLGVHGAVNSQRSELFRKIFVIDAA